MVGAGAIATEGVGDEGPAQQRQQAEQAVLQGWKQLRGICRRGAPDGDRGGFGAQGSPQDFDFGAELPLTEKSNQHQRCGASTVYYRPTSNC